MRKYANIVMAIALSTTSSMAQVKLNADNIEEVIKAMTLQEKADLLVGRSNNSAANSSNGLIGSHAELVEEVGTALPLQNKQKKQMWLY